MANLLGAEFANRQSANYTPAFRQKDKLKFTVSVRMRKRSDWGSKVRPVGDRRQATASERTAGYGRERRL